MDLLVWQKTELGFKVIVDNRYAGLVYDKDIYRILHTGDRLKGYIKAVRPDGKIGRRCSRQEEKHGGLC